MGEPSIFGSPPLMHRAAGLLGRLLLLAALLESALSLGCASPAPSAGTPGPPLPPVHPSDTLELPWAEEVILWSGELHGNKTPWRDLPELQSRFHSAEYPDDLQVGFRQDHADAWELMWVRVIGMHAGSGEYLGKLLNDPYDIAALDSGHNVVFVTPEASEYPIAVDRGAGYGRSGYPPFSPDDFASRMIEGLELYRVGQMGDAPESLDSAISELLLASELVDITTSNTARFYVYFYLGRCYAELYETHRVVEAFTNALSYRPKDPNAHIALLAEYSVLATTDDDELESSTQAYWRDQFVQQEARIRSLAPITNAGIAYLDVIYSDMRDELGDSDTLAGKFVLRWKGK